MIDEQLLKNITALNDELEDLRRRLKRIENKECTILKDSVKGSSKTYPYIQHNCVIEGVEYSKSKKFRYTYKKQIKSKERELEKLINQLEYQLNYIENEIRQIIRYKYEDNKTWIQIMFLMKYNSESVAKMKLKRFFGKDFEM